MGRLIAFSGKARSGKTTAARRLCELIAEPGSGECAIESFATPLKNIVQEHFSYRVSTEDLVHNKNKIISFGNKEMTVRQLLIEVGRMYRAIDPDFWVSQLMAKIQQNQKWGCKAVVIDDMRYPNEYEILRAAGATLIRIERPGVELIDDPSETSLDYHKFDAVVTNDGTMEQFYSKLGLVPGLLAAASGSGL